MRTSSCQLTSPLLEGGRPALPTRTQWGSRPGSAGISRDVLDRVLDEPDQPPDNKTGIYVPELLDVLLYKLILLLFNNF